MAKVKRKKSKKQYYVIPKDKAETIVKKAFEDGALLWIDGGAWGNTKKLDKSLLGNLPKSQIRASQNLVKREGIQEIKSWINKAHNYARINSMPWVTSAVHFIEKTKVDEADKFLNKCVTGLREAITIYVDGGQYEKDKKQFQKEFPQLYKPQYYPSPEMLKAKFRLRYGFQCITLPSDGKIQVLSKERLMQEDLKYKQRMKEAFEESVNMIRFTFKKMIDHLSERLEPGKKFQDSSIENIKDFLNKFKDVNLFGDKPFEGLVNECLDVFNGTYADDIRDDNEYREIMKEAVDIIGKEVDKLPIVKMERDIDIDF